MSLRLSILPPNPPEADASGGVGAQGVDYTRSVVSWLTMLDESILKTGADRTLVDRTIGKQCTSSVYFTTRF